MERVLDTRRDDEGAARNKSLSWYLGVEGGGSSAAGGGVRGEEHGEPDPAETESNTLSTSCS